MTNLLLYWTLGVTGAVVLALVVYLLGIIWALWGTLSNLNQLAAGLVAVRDHCEPLPEHLQAINGGLGTLLTKLLAVNNNLGAIVKVAQGNSD